MPRLGSQKPDRDKLMTTAAHRRLPPAGMQEMVEEYEAKFGLDKPLWMQYLTYLTDVAPFRLQLLDRQLSAHGHRHDLRRACPGRSGCSR